MQRTWLEDSCGSKKAGPGKFWEPIIPVGYVFEPVNFCTVAILGDFGIFTSKIFPLKNEITATLFFLFDEFQSLF